MRFMSAPTSSITSVGFASVPSHLSSTALGLKWILFRGDGETEAATMEELNEVAARLRAARSVFVLTGSGISAESGLPTFRGAGGLWRTHRVEQLASPHGFARDPILVWTWYNERNFAHRRARPNAGHYALATMEVQLRDFTLATQNVDSLHVRAGSRAVLELHGNLREARCDRCGSRRPLDATGMPLAEIEHACGGRMRPDIVWFGESLPHEQWERARNAASRADVILVVGTSAVVYPAAALAANAFGNAYVVEINPEATAITGAVNRTLRGTAAAVLPQLAELTAAARGS
jgi:NAD-dependent deacetylase